MGKYAMIKKEFKFLTSSYGFDICMKQKHGAYYYIEWTNSNTNIMVLYDEQVDERIDSPITIRVYDADSLGFDAVEYKKEFALKTGSPRERIHCASEWLKNAIADKIIKI